MCTAIDQLLLSLLLSDVPVDLAVVVFFKFSAGYLFYQWYLILLFSTAMLFQIKTPHRWKTVSVSKYYELLSKF